MSEAKGLSPVDRKSLLRVEAAAGFLIRAGAAGLGFLINAMIAAKLGPQGYGVYATLMAASGLLAMVATLGWPAFVLREIAALDGDAAFVKARSLIAASGLSSFLAGVILGAALFVLPALTGRWAILQQAGPIAVAIAAAMVPLQALLQVRAGLVRGFHRPLRADIPELAVRPILTALFVGTAIISGLLLTLEGLLALQLLAFVSAFFFGLPFLSRIWRARGAQPPAAPMAMRPAYSFWLIGLAGLLLAQLPIYLVGMLANPADTGRFAFAVQIASILNIAVLATELPIQSRLVAARSRGDMAAFERTARDAGWLAFGVSLFAGTAVVLLGRPLMALIGPDYPAAFPALIILLVGAVVQSSFGPCRVALSMTGNERVVLIAVCASAFSALASGLLLIPAFGIEGGAIAGALATAGLNIGMFVVCRQRLDISTAPLFPGMRKI